MKTNLITVFLVFITLLSIGQINFESGYFIDNNNNRVECLIKNSDWKNNPTQFEYKLTTNDETQKGTLITAKEFGIKGFSRFVKADTKIDISPSDIDNLSRDRNPVWSQERIFLKVLVEGKATLYYYENKGLIRFFYSVSDTAINQLIYKEYYTPENQVAENRQFRGQLWNDVRLTNANMNSVQDIRYYISDLVRYFKKYNEGDGNSSTVFGSKEKKDSFHIRVTPGISFASMSISDLEGSGEVIDFGEKATFSFGFDAELILPFNKNKWGLFINPTYQYFNSSIPYFNSTISANYQSLEFPLGLRYYIFLNQNMKLFANAEFILMRSISFDSKIYGMNVNTRNSYAIGCGVAYKKLSAEIRYYTDRELLYDYISVNTDYTRLSILFGYKIF
jgi:hypothetical protein